MDEVKQLGTEMENIQCKWESDSSIENTALLPKPADGEKSFRITLRCMNKSILEGFSYIINSNPSFRLLKV